MKKTFISLLAALLCVLPVAADRYTDMAQRQYEWVKAGMGDSIRLHATPEVNAQLPASAVAAVWQQLTAQVGALQKEGAWSQVESQGFTVCLRKLTFERGALQLNVVLDNELRLAGFHFAPAAPDAEEKETVPETNDSLCVPEREITIAHGGIALPGTLTLPPDVQSPVACVVLVHGSGPNDRDETVGPNKLFRSLAHALAEQGIAVVRYDKRTYVYGPKTASVSGGILNYDTETVDDAVAALEYVRTMPEVDEKSVFLLGHSLGGNLAPRIAVRSEKKPAGLIYVAALARPFWEVVQEQLTYIAGTEEKEVAKREEKVRRMMQQVRAAVPEEYIAFQKTYDALQTAKSLGELPMLFVQGGQDYQVTEQDFSLWKTALAGEVNKEFAFFPALDHLMRPLSEKAVPADYNRFIPMSEEAIKRIADFIRTHSAAV